MKLLDKGFTAVEIVMVVVTLVVIGGGLFVVLTQDPITAEDEAASEQVAEIERPTSDMPDSDASDQLTEANQRDEVRKQHIKLVAQELDAYFALNNRYPTQAEFQNEDFRVSNLYKDGNSKSAYTQFSIAYNVRPSSCDNDTFICASFDVTADLERDGLGADDADNDTSDAIELSAN